MANSIGGNGGIDSSSLDQLLSQLGEILNKQSEINTTKVKPKVDDSELKPIRKSLETIREEVEKTNSSEIDFLNTRVIKKSINNALSELDRIKKITHNFEDDIKDVNILKTFIKNFELLNGYSKKFGKNLVEEYRKIFDEMTNEDMLHIDIGFDITGLNAKEIDKLYYELQEKIKRIKQEAEKSARTTINMEVGYATDDYYNDLAKERKRAYDNERQAAIESANTIKEAERQKQEALLNTRNELVKGVKSQLQKLNSSAGDDKFLEIDYDQWGKFQKSAGDMIQTLAEMGVEVRELEDLLDSISKKVYLPKDQLGAVKQGSITKNVIGDTSELDKAQQKVDELYNEIASLQNMLYNSPTDYAFDEVSKNYEEARQEIYRLKNEIDDLNIELRNSVDYWTWNQKVENVEKLEKEVDDLKNKLKSTRDGSGNGFSDEISKGFNSEELSSFLNILERIEEQLRNISSTLGSVDKNSGFNNIISSVDILLLKLDEMHKKIGTGVYNISVNQGSDEKTFAQDESVKAYIRDTKNRYSNAYDKIVQKAGGEELLFARINNILNTGIDQLKETYSSISVSQIESKEQQVYRLIDFFKLLRQAMADEYFGLDLSDIRIPSASDENFRKQLKNKSGESERRKKQNIQDDLLSDESEKSLPGLNQITEVLERIEVLITEISQKDLFGDSLIYVSEQLDEITSKFDKLVSDVRIINEEPILTTNKNGLSSDTEDIKKAAEVIQAEGEVAKKSAEQKEAFVLANQKVAESGIETAEGIKRANDSIREEGQLVSENINQFTEAEKKRQSLYKQMQKTSSDKQSTQEKQRQSEINTLLSEQKNAYQRVWDIRKQLTKLDPDKNSEEVSELERQKKLALEVYTERTKELKALDEIANSEAQNNTLLELRRKAINEIAIIKAKISDKNHSSGSGNSSSDSSKTKKYYDSIKSSISKVDDLLAKPKLLDTQRSQLNQIKEDLIKIRETPLDIIPENLNNKLEETREKIKNLDREISNSENRVANEKTIQKSLGRIRDILSTNTKNSFVNSTLHQQFVNLQNQFEKFDTSKPQGEVNKLVTELTRLEAEFKGLDKSVTGGNFISKFSNRLTDMNAKFLAQYFSFQDWIRYGRTALNTIRELDTALVDLRKTTTMSNSELNQFYFDSNDVAKQLGVTTAEVITQASAWSRLGYSTKEEATEMAKLSSQFAAISPGMDIEQSTDGLVSTMKAFDIEYDNVLDGIMSKINIIGNTAATSNSEIVDMLTRSSAAMAEANNTLEETIALETAAVEITRNAETTGTTFKTLAMRIRGYDEDGEVLEDYEELKGKIADLTKTSKTPGGISLFTDASKTEFKSTYQLLKDIHEIYSDLTDKQQAGLLEALAGKRGGQVVASVLNNWDAVSNAIDNMTNSAGNADAEMEVIKQSWDYKINALKETWVGTLQELINREDIGKLIDGLTSISEVIGSIVGNLGLVKTALIGISAIWGSKKLGYKNSLYIVIY